MDYICVVTVVIRISVKDSRLTTFINKNMGKCIVCSKRIVGRSDKKFCSVACKSYYHHQLRKVTKEATRHIDEILHRNRSIRLEIMGKHYLRNTFLALLPQ